MRLQRFSGELIRPGQALLALVITIVPHFAQTQQSCFRLEGIVTDPASALIAGAQVEAPGGPRGLSDSNGRFSLACVPAATNTVRVTAPGFATKSARVPRPREGLAQVIVQLTIADSETNVEVKADADTLEGSGGLASTELARAQVQEMPDDPDDFLRQLQVLAAAAGGDPNSMTLTVDGFQNGSALPPKSAIASIRVNPDLFSSEYQWPPFHGGVVEIITKPGADALHGAAFFTESDSAFNATDPFSVAATPAGKQRYGFELAGPIVKAKSGFSLAIERRSIDEFNVVNAITLDASGTQSPFLQTVSAPQRLWIGSARGDWQVTPKDTATLSFSANVNDLGNQGVGGLVLPEAGYASTVSEYDLRLSNSYAASANLLYESRAGYSWKRTSDTPNSTAPELQVAGFFLGGGAATQNLNNGEQDLEIDNDMMRTLGRHTLRIGEQALGIFVRDFDPDTFNGAFVFGGGGAPMLDANNNPTGGTTSITGIEQYRRALLGLPGGAPTTYQLTTGSPLVPLAEGRIGLFAQDSIKLLPRLTLDAGFRYQLRVDPNSYIGFEPRLGFAWSPDARQRWVIHLRGGLFHSPSLSDELPVETRRLNRIRQQETLIYAPSFNDPQTPAAGSIAVSTRKQLAPTLTQQSTFCGYLNIERVLPREWHVRANLFWGEDWNSVRIRNINAPMVVDSVGAAPDPTAALLAPRPLVPNENILQYENSGHLSGNVLSLNIDQHAYKRFGMSFRYGHMIFKSNAADSAYNSPQSSYSDQGESARVEWSRDSFYSFTGNLVLPRKIEAATQLDTGTAAPFDVVTGTDNNGDGNFNDRPSYASAPGPGVYSTRFGLLTANTVNGDVPRNIGRIPGPMHLDMNLSRAFRLGAQNSDHERALTFNVRSANLLNHTNVTAVGTVVSAPNLGQPIAAEAARRIEMGVRFAF